MRDHGQIKHIKIPYSPVLQVPELLIVPRIQWYQCLNSKKLLEMTS